MKNSSKKDLEKDKDMYHIYETKNQKGICFLVRITYQSDGERKEIKKSFPVYKYGSQNIAIKAAKNWRNTKIVEVHQNIIIQPEPKRSLTLDEIFEKTVEKRSKSFETNRKWRLWYGKYITSVIPGKTQFAKIGWDEISNTINAMIDNSSQDMINRVITMWSKMCAYAIYCDVIVKNPMVMLEVEDKAESKKVYKSRNKKLDLNSFKKLLEDFPYRKNSVKEAFFEMTALIIMAYVGLRPAEVFILSKTDIDLNNRTIHIFRRLGSTTTEKFVEAPLGRKGYDRFIPYPMQIDELLETLIEKAESDKLFIVNGKCLNSDILSSDVKRISNGKIRPYMLRHAFSNDLIINKNDGKEEL